MRWMLTPPFFFSFYYELCMFKLKFSAERAFWDNILYKKTLQCTSRRQFFLLNREQKWLTSEALPADEQRGIMIQRSKNAKLHLMFMLLAFEWQPEQNKIIKKMRKSHDEDQWPLSTYNFNFDPKFNLLFIHSTQVKEINLLYTLLPINQHIFFWRLWNITNSSRLWETAIKKSFVLKFWSEMVNKQI